MKSWVIAHRKAQLPTTLSQGSATGVDFATTSTSSFRQASPHDAAPSEDHPSEASAAEDVYGFAITSLIRDKRTDVLLRPATIYLSISIQDGFGFLLASGKGRHKSSSRQAVRKDLKTKSMNITGWDPHRIFSTPRMPFAAPAYRHTKQAKQQGARFRQVREFKWYCFDGIPPAFTVPQRQTRKGVS